jgi:hypothetical protein
VGAAAREGEQGVAARGGSRPKFFSPDSRA